MSEATASSTDAATVFVRLLDEGVDVWRPVRARRLSAATFRLADDPVPAEESWSYPPGATVVAEARDHGAGPVLIAVARASAFDARSLAVSAAG